MRLIDLTGKQFGELTVLYRAEDHIRPSGQKVVYWHCRCSCSNEGDFEGSALREGSVRSCGCQTNNFIRQARKKVNRYNLTNEYGIGYTTKGEIFYFDLEDYDTIKDFCWFVSNTGYMCAKCPDGKHVLQHQLIFGHGTKVDHKNGNTIDNRKENLRLTNDSLNQMNKSIQKNNQSGYPGVTWHTRDGIWEAHISKDGKQYYLGRFTNFDDAVARRQKAEDEIFGEWAYRNSREEN